MIAYMVDFEYKLERQCILAMAQGLDLVIVNTSFKKEKNILFAYRSGPHASQIEFNMIMQEDINACTTAK